jgi:hypothetical protein
MPLIQQPAPTPPPIPEIPDWILHRGPAPMEIAIAVVFVLGSVGALGILWTLARGLVRKWMHPPANQQVLDDLRHSVQQLTAEVTELQERLDFAERMLAAHREPARIARPGE